MPTPSSTVATARCACGAVAFEASGRPIASVVCYCEDCQAGARQIEALPNAPPVGDPDGGTGYVLYRKDRAACSKGAELLKAYRIAEKSATSRLVASCCNSAMTMTFDDSRHWLPVHRARFEGKAPPLEMRICTRFKPREAVLPGDVPSHQGYPLKFMARLLSSYLAMLLRR